MAMIVCPECGKEVSDQAEVCIHCGYPFHKLDDKKLNIDKSVCEVKDKIKKNKKIVGILGIIIALIVVIVLVVTNINSPLSKAKKYYEKKDFESYSEIKKEMKTQDVSSFINILVADIEIIEKNYYSEKITYEDAISELEEILKYSDTTHLNNYDEIKQGIDQLHISRNAFEEAVEFEES